MKYNFKKNICVILGIYKKLIKVSARRACEVIKKWARSISNHMYWSATSSNGDSELARAKWTSIVRHVSNQHSGHGEVFTQCEHGDLDEPREWILPGMYRYYLNHAFI